MNEESIVLFENGLVWQWPSSIEPKLKVPPANWFTVVGSKFGEIGYGSPPAGIHAKRRIDLHGKLVLPGIHDSHIHVQGLGESVGYLDLFGCESLGDFKERLRSHLQASKSESGASSSSWIIGFGWEQDKLGRYPSRQDLDEIVRERPVLLWRACFHVAVVNTKALEVAGFDLKNGPWEVPGGLVDVDNGSPTGILREAAVTLVHKHTAETSEETRIKYMDNGLQKCLQFGITAVHTNDRNSSWKLYQRLQSEGKLKLRVYLTPDHCEIGKAGTPLPGTKDGLLSCDRVKVFSDGSLGAETAALRLPYRGTNNNGVLIHTDNEMLKIVSEAEKSGYRLEIHAIGDKAAAQVISAIRQAGVPRYRRPILTHAQVLGPDLIEEMVHLGVIANIQPSFVITDAAFVNMRLDESCLPYAYCWKRMMEAGVVCAGGSDAPIETPNPFQGIYDAMFRSKDGKDKKSFFPNQCLTFPQALCMYTRNGAYAAMEENQLGEIRQNFKADFVILNENVVENFKSLLNPSLVSEVWIDGVQRYSQGDQKYNPVMSFNKSSFEGKNGKIRMCDCCRN